MSTNLAENADTPDASAAGATPKPWLAAYDPGVPTDVTLPDRPLDQLLTESAARWPRRAAMRFLGRVVSYRELDEAANRFAHALMRLGVRRGDRVALLLPNCPQFVIAFFGALRAGAVVSPTSPLYVEPELQHQFADSGARVVVCLSALFGKVSAIRGELPNLEHVISANIKEYFPPVTRLLFTLAREEKEGHRVRLPAEPWAHAFPDLLAEAPATPPGIQVGAEDLAVLQYTGGTTGVPKAAMLSHRNLVANATQTSAWLGPANTDDRPDITLGVIPLFHIYGITSVMTSVVMAGGTMVLQPRFVVRDVLRAIQKERPHRFPGVPTMYMAINTAPDVGKYNLRSLEACISGAAPLPQEVQTRFEALTGAKLVEGYGLTEASPVTHCTPLEGRRKIGSIGVPIPGTDAAIFAGDTPGERLAVGEIGELAIRGPQVMQGYWQRPDETAKVLKDGWLFTGDIARMDVDGFFQIVDRKKDMIISGGMNVYPRDVEEPLYRHPAVQEAVVVGVPDPRWGEAVKAFVVLKPGSSVTEAELLEYCRAEMAAYRVPKSIEFRTELPKSLVGKFLRRQLLEEEKAKLAAGEGARR